MNLFTSLVSPVPNKQYTHCIIAGDLLREEQKRPDSKYGELIQNYIRDGLIVPMEVTIALLENAMQKEIEQGKMRFLIDGFPRQMDQAVKFEETVVESKFVLYFTCSEKVLLERLLRRGESSGRVDDNIESIKKRFQTFKDTSYPVIEAFEKEGKVREVSNRIKKKQMLNNNLYKINAENGIEEVYEQVKKAFNSL